AAADDTVPLGAEGDTGDTLGVPLEAEDWGTGPAVPYLEGSAVAAGAGDPFAVGAERRIVPPERVDLLAGLGLPYFERSVVAAAGDPFAIRAERHAVDRVGMPLKGQQLLTRLGIPKPHRPVLAAASEAFAVRTEDYAVDGPGMPLKHE